MQKKIWWYTANFLNRYRYLPPSLPPFLSLSLPLPPSLPCLHFVIGFSANLEDGIYCGIGTHFVPSASIDSLRQALQTEDVSSPSLVEKILHRFARKVTKKGKIELNREKID